MDDQKNVCTRCGTDSRPGQKFCSKCGMPQPSDEIKNECSKCGIQLQADQTFCNQCGHRVGHVLDEAPATAISQFNQRIETQKSRVKALPFVIVLIILIIVATGYYIYNISLDKKTEEYMSNVSRFTVKSINAGTNLEAIADTVQKYWYENIHDGKWGKDIDEAIANGLKAKASDLRKADYDFEEMKDLYSEVRNVPKGVKDSYLEEVARAVRELYNSYTEFHYFATDPSGSYNTFSSANTEKKKAFLSKYIALSNLLD